MSQLQIADTPIAGLKIIERIKQADERGFFSRMFCGEELLEAGWSAPIAQINQSMTRRAGAVRGLHFQVPPHAEMKLVNCVRGAVFDVAVDLRRGSPTFLKWFGTELSAENRRALLIPEGFAHGFQTLVTDCELIYFHSAAYHAASEGAVHVEDPRLGISWPRPIAELSARDSTHRPLQASFDGIEL
jgi:dTDP-4-dehydrorhamnose 3,5-epimerase